MGRETTISWTQHTFNPWIGCTKVSPGCDNCYAESQDHRWGHDRWGKGKPRMVTSAANWKQPLVWNREAQAEGRRDLVFCASLADVMDDEVPGGVRERLWELIDQTPYLTWQLLTKRPHRYPRYLPRKFAHNNVWLGTSAENQQFYDVRWAILRLVAHDLGLTSFISYEPALGPLSMDAFPDHSDGKDEYPDWVICGGESGVGRRPAEQVWFEDLRKEAEDAGVSFFMKQMSARTPADGAALIPAHLLIRQFPAVR